VSGAVEFYRKFFEPEKHYCLDDLPHVIGAIQADDAASMSAR
jgi:hypothetical protein